MVCWPPYPWCIDILPMVFWPPTNGIWSPIPMVYWLTTHGILTLYPWYIDPLFMIFWPPAYILIRNEGGQNAIWHRSFLHSWPITGFVIRLTRRVPLVEQEQLTFPEHPSSVPVFSGVCFTWSLVLCVFCRSLFVLFCHCVVRPSIYGFLLPLSALVSWNSS